MDLKFKNSRQISPLLSNRGIQETNFVKGGQKRIKP